MGQVLRKERRDRPIFFLDQVRTDRYPDIRSGRGIPGNIRCIVVTFQSCLQLIDGQQKIGSQWSAVHHLKSSSPIAPFCL
uniref:Uncharacterized protein n=1 Tax=Picea glauca TaxID=3330 RepID=A0A101M060_PICGL|nr:hypothetical protein ABT39_MTgene4580 [Picea glauca]